MSRRTAPGPTPLGRARGPAETFLGLLAILSVGIFLIPYLDVLHLRIARGDYLRWVVPVDLAICAIFVIDYLVRLGRSGARPLAFARANPLQPLAMIPLSTPIISDIEVFLIVIVAARFVRAFNVVFGEQAFQGIIRRYSGILAREVADAVLVRSMATAREVAARGRFARWVGDALDRRRPEVHMVVVETLDQLPAWQRFRKLPGAEDVIRKGEDLVVDLVIESLRSERLNILVANVIDDSIEEFERAVEERHPGVMIDALGPDAAGRAPLQRRGPGPSSRSP